MHITLDYAAGTQNSYLRGKTEVASSNKSYAKAAAELEKCSAESEPENDAARAAYEKIAAGLGHPPRQFSDYSRGFDWFDFSAVDNNVLGISRSEYTRAFGGRVIGDCNENLEMVFFPPLDAPVEDQLDWYERVKEIDDFELMTVRSNITDVLLYGSRLTGEDLPLDEMRRRIYGRLNNLSYRDICQLAVDMLQDRIDSVHLPGAEICRPYVDQWRAEQEIFKDAVAAADERHPGLYPTSAGKSKDIWDLLDSSQYQRQIDHKAIFQAIADSAKARQLKLYEDAAAQTINSLIELV